MTMAYCYMLTIALCAVCFAQGLRALATGSYKGQDYFKKRRCLYFIVAGLTTESLLATLLFANMIGFTLKGGELPMAFNLWIFHTFGRLCLLAFHNDMLCKTKAWRGAVDKYGKDNRKA